MSKEIFESSLDLIQDVIGFVCRRQRYFDPESEDFRSYVHLRLLEDDCAVLTAFKGQSSFRTYLVAVIVRMGLDYRVQKWGKWRPSAVARNLGPVAVDLETLMYRDGHPAEEAIGILENRLQSEISGSELRELAGRLPVRFRRHFEGEEAIRSMPAAIPNPESDLLRQQHSRELDEALRVLRNGLKELESEERTILRMHFEEQFNWNEIATVLGIDARKLYRIKERVLRKLRIELGNRGVSSFPWAD